MKSRIKELRESKHLTQLGLALKVGSTQQSISKLEKGCGIPKLDLALKLAAFFNVTVEYLFCISDRKHQIEHQIQIDRLIEEYYDFFIEYKNLTEQNKITLSILMRRLTEVQESEEEKNGENCNM